jgi:hypothetical protein
VIGTLANIANLIGAMIRRPAEVRGLQLLASGIGVWVSNVLVFSLLYWQINRSGPGPPGEQQGPQAGLDLPLNGRARGCTPWLEADIHRLLTHGIFNSNGFQSYRCLAADAPRKSIDDD